MERSQDDDTTRKGDMRDIKNYKLSSDLRDKKIPVEWKEAKMMILHEKVT